MAHVVVVGAGITGLAAAWHLITRGDHQVTVLEGSGQVGGRLRSAELAGVRIDVGAESMLARRPEAVDLLGELGAEAVHPAPVGAALWSRGRLSPLPRGTLMGVPARPEAAGSVLDADEIERAVAERPVAVDGDISVGDLVERAVGPAVVDQLVEPLLGGVYAGHARRLSAAACVPALLDAVRDGGSLTAAAARAAERAAAGARQGPAAPVFAGLRGGVSRLPDLLEEQLVARGATVRTGVTVRELQRTATGWRLVTGPVPQPEALEADAVIVTTPARAAARLVGEVVPHASGLLADVEYASMAIVSMAFPVDEMPWAPTDSGFLVPPVDGHVIKAATFSSVKWPWLADRARGLLVLRVSMGRHGEEAVLQRDDAELVDLGRADLQAALGQQLPRAVDAHVQRWGGALPQYAVGHLDRVDSIATAVAGVPGLELAGAAYDGVGIPACIASGRAAADRALTHLNVVRQRVGE
ncbi:protoporphyrinogen oxidase [Luteipulveratus halotolerans]|uniref:Coproporphyrinogen III oxidase n=1 Tax=Luteipulveratus halotolerans TaxID=1631356 RepID=A0A0L6CP18_9MICO|nr:protoporphyrinogen oxidase [Luteipulveratus halotolerans]KNX39283.1 hypothetical protein VV01_07440 [Luteipulveratus halotolerans]